MPIQNFEVVRVADVDAEERVDDSLEEILNLNFGQDVEAENLVKTFKYIFGQEIEAEIWSKF